MSQVMAPRSLGGSPNGSIRVAPPPNRLTNVTAHYAGEMVDDKRDGTGTYVYDNKFFQYQGV